MKGFPSLSPPVFRFAPSPNGFLHLGHAYSALLNERMAREAGGQLLLRIEDIDTGRCRQEYEAAIFEDLEWLGLHWEQPVRRQSGHFTDYASALRRLSAMGLIYPSFLSRKQIEEAAAMAGHALPRDPAGVQIYSGGEHDLDPETAAGRVNAGESHSLRLNMQKALARVGKTPAWIETGSGNQQKIAADPADWGDIILARKETPTSYHLSVTVDDALQGVTHIVRGMDLFHSTSIHRLLQSLLGMPEPVYHHHRLIDSDKGSKLSKSMGSQSLRDLRAQGTTANDIRKLLGFLPVKTG